MNTLCRLSPGGLPPTAEATRCSADPNPQFTRRLGCTQSLQVGGGTLLPYFFLPGRSPEVQTAKVSLEACLGASGTTVFCTVATSLLLKVPENLPPGLPPPSQAGFEADNQKNLEKDAAQTFTHPELNCAPCRLQSCMAVCSKGPIFFIGKLRGRSL